MDKAKEALKAELMELYSQSLDEMLAECSEQADFTVLEEQVERLASKALPQTMSTLVEKRGLFPPEL